MLSTTALGSRYHPAVSWTDQTLATHSQETPQRASPRQSHTGCDSDSRSRPPLAPGLHPHLKHPMNSSVFASVMSPAFSSPDWLQVPLPQQPPWVKSLTHVLQGHEVILHWGRQNRRHRLAFILWESLHDHYRLHRQMAGQTKRTLGTPCGDEAWLMVSPVLNETTQC